MLRKILRKISARQLGKKGASQQKQEQQPVSNPARPQTGRILSPQLAENLAFIREKMGQNVDLVIREFSFGHEEKIKVALVYMEGLVNRTEVNSNLIKPLMYDSQKFDFKELRENINLEFLREKMVSVCKVRNISCWEQLLDDCLYGDTILLLEGCAAALSIGTKGWKTRSIEEPKTETVVRGPREGFTETLGFNTALLRRKIRHPDFVIEATQVGKMTRTKLCLAYLKGVVDPALVAEVKRRLLRIDTDAILSSGYIEEFIEDAPFSPFPTVGNSERPDNAAAKILEGRVAILVDGTPMALMVPLLFVESFQSSEDYYSRPYYASIVRMMRYLAYFISISAPAIYVALTAFHQELIPTPLLMTIAAAREGTPFPTVVEVIVMITIFEILREAGIRLPRAVGSAISIVGALVIGEAAVSAGLIGAPMVIVIALTAITSFVVPAQIDTGVVLRIVLTLATGIMGAFGFFIALLGLIIHLTALRSFGTPYFAPFAPLIPQDLKDALIRVPLPYMLTRPQAISHYNRKREKVGLVPRPPKK